MGRKGLTLIELLVVIAIIAILAAILFPVFARAREKARQTSCLANLKQSALAVHMYAQDYDERLPTWYDPAGTTGGWWANPQYIMWFHVVMPYIKNQQMLQCPSQPNNYQGGGFNGTWECGYGVNCGWMNQTKLGSIPRPAERVYAGDKWTTDPRLSPNNGGGGCNGGVASYADNSYHNEGANYALCDGHAKWYKYPVVFKVYTDAAGVHAPFFDLRDEPAQ